jgi:putative selenate reductase
MKDANNTKMFNDCLNILRRDIKKFKRFKNEDIDKISSRISNMVTLSTMHGCRAEEISDIARHLIKNKKINTFIKCNPTLLGYDNVRSILDGLGYNDVVIRKEDFEHDLKFDAAVEIVEELKRLGRENGVNTGIKLTNTLPVCNSRGILPGKSMYMSGKPLYPIAAGVAGMFAERFGEEIHVSMSGGIDKNNVLDVLKAGIYPVTTATLLLKPGGYKNMKGLMDIISEGHIKYGKLNPEAIKELSEKSRNDSNYKNSGERRQIDDTLPVFDCFKTNCGICVDVCPNRANMRSYDDRFGSAYQIIHIDSRCNECGNCHTFCTRGGFPYLKKVTLFADKVEYENSGNPGILKLGTGKFMLRDENKNEWVYEPDGDETAAEKSEIEMILEKLAAEYPYLLK